MPVRFPRLSSRGPIEAGNNCALSLTQRCFRDYQVAAPLKRFRRARTDEPRTLFPRLSSRGPIEAGLSASRSISPDAGFRDYQVAAPLKRVAQGTAIVLGPAFPRLSSRGPIEADYLQRIRPRGKRFPRLSSRGPIEASFVASNGDGTNAGFRDYQVAAPLKLTVSSTFSHGPNWFPRLSSRGPIEAFGTCCMLMITSVVSATIKSRPH